MAPRSACHDAAARTGMAEVRRGRLPDGPGHDGSGRHVRSRDAARGGVSGLAPMTAAVVENLAAAVVLSAMMIVPLADVAARFILHHGITGSGLIVQHLGLVLGMLGGAIAAREGRLLALSMLGAHARAESAAGVARILAASMSAAMSGLLAFAGYRFVETEYRFGKTLVYGIPVWLVE